MSGPAAAVSPILQYVAYAIARIPFNQPQVCSVANLLASYPLTRESLEAHLADLEADGLILRTPNADGSFDVVLTERGFLLAWERDQHLQEGSRP